MGESTEKSALERIAEVLLAHGVEFIVIGGQAELLLGSPRTTYDVDLCYRRTRENLRKLAEALGQLHPSLRGAPPGLPFKMDARTLEMGLNFTLSTPVVDLDLIGYVEPLGEYDAILKNAESYQIGDVQLRVVSLDDLIAIKRHINRPKDREALLQLLAIKRLRP